MEIIAECGVNWKDTNEAVQMILKAKDIGINYCKFQIWKKEQMKPELHHCYIDKEKAHFLIDVGKINGIEVFFTPFYPEAVYFLEELGVNYYKIRFKDRYQISEEIQRAVRATNKPFFVSSINPTYWKFSINLECVPNYPANPAHYYLVDKNFQGVSDHTPTFDVFERAKEKYWLKFFEMHMCLTKNCWEHQWSKTFEEVSKHL